MLVAYALVHNCIHFTKSFFIIIPEIDLSRRIYMGGIKSSLGCSYVHVKCRGYIQGAVKIICRLIFLFQSHARIEIVPS